MAERMTAAEYQRLAQAGKVNKKGRITLPDVKRASEVDPPKKSKYNNTIVVDPETGVKVHSETEMKDKTLFRQEYKKGEILLYSPQPELWIASKQEKYIADHLWVTNDGKVHIADSKSSFTVEDSTWRAKFKRAVKAYPDFVFHVMVGNKYKNTKDIPVGLPPKK